MDFIGDYTHNKPFYIMPKFIWHLDLSHCAMLLYSRIYSRCMLSKKNELLDEDGRAFCYYPVANMAVDLRCSVRTVQNVLNELEKFDLIERHRRGSKANRIYAKHTFFPYGETISNVERVDLMREVNGDDVLSIAATIYKREQLQQINSSVTS